MDRMNIKLRQFDNVSEAVFFNYEYYVRFKVIHPVELKAMALSVNRYEDIVYLRGLNRTVTTEHLLTIFV